MIPTRAPAMRRLNGETSRGPPWRWRRCSCGPTQRMLVWNTAATRPSQEGAWRNGERPALAAVTFKVTIEAMIVFSGPAPSQVGHAWYAGASGRVKGFVVDSLQA